MIRKILGETFEVLTTGIFAGFFANWIPKIWNALKDGVGHPLVKDYIEKRVVSAKGLKDSHLFAYFLSASKIPLPKRRQIEHVFNFIEALNPKYAENARLIIAMDEIGRGTATVNATGGTVTPTPDPKYKHPGISILKHLAECNTDMEMISAIMAMGAFNEAPNGTIDEIQLWAKNVALPAIIELLSGAAHATGDVIYSGLDYLHRPIYERKVRTEDRRRRRRENPLNWLNPVLWFQSFRDLT